MAAFTSKASGNWSASGQTTWNEAGVPASGDTVTIGSSHTITVDINTTVGAGGGAGTTAIAANGHLTIAAGIVLTVKGDVVLGNATLRRNAGAELVFDTTGGDRKLIMGTAVSQANCNFLAVGTTGSHCKFRKTGSNRAWCDEGGAGSGSMWDTTGLDITYDDWTGITNADGSIAFPVNTFGSCHIRIAHCTFDGCGAMLGNRPYQWDGAANKDYSITDVKCINSTGTYSFRCVIGATVGSGLQQFKRVSLNKSLDGGGKLVVSDVLFRGGMDWNGGPAISMTNVLFHCPLAVPQVLSPHNITDFYWLAGVDHPGNPHMVNVGANNLTFYGGVMEYPIALNIDGGDAIYGPTATGTKADHCLVLPSVTDGEASANMISAQTNSQGIQALHCTVVGKSQPIGFCEATGSLTGAGFSAIRSNLAVSLVDSSAWVINDIFAATQPGRTDLSNPATTTHNGKFGVGSYLDPVRSVTYVGYKARYSADPGANDVTGNPNFVDPTRNFSAWAVHKGVASGGDTLATKTTAGLNLIETDPTLIISDLIPWVRDGFAPTNAIFQNAGHDGATIGAVEFVGGGGGSAIGPKSSYYRRRRAA